MCASTLVKQLNSHPTSTIPMWLKRVRPDILEWLISETAQYPVKNTMERIFIILNGQPPKCTDGNYRKFDTYEKGYRLGCQLSHACSDVVKNRVNNQRITLMEKYGVTNAAQLETVQLKIKETNLRKYGTEHHSRNIDVKEKAATTRKNKTRLQHDSAQQKRKQTSLRKYGVEHHMMLKSQQTKVQEVTAGRYGQQFPLQNKISLDKMKNTIKELDRETINNKTRQTMLGRYGATSYSRINLSTSTISILDDKDKFTNEVTGKYITEITDSLDVSTYTVVKYAKKYNVIDLIRVPPNSSFEVQVSSYLDSIGVKYIQNTRSVIAPKELDFYLPDHKLAIECCGLYWHSELSAGRDKQYHSKKFIQCREKNIDLLTIFDDEWNNNEDIVKRIIKNKILKGNKIYARKCEVVECNSKVAKKFINDNHLQQYSPASIKLGLEYDGKLVAVMTFGKSRYVKNCNSWEMIRFCSTHNVVGGASKLLSHFKTMITDAEIISYSDNRWFNGNMYHLLGFKKMSETIGYFYTNYKHRFNRMNFQKHKLVREGFDASLTEWEIMQQRGFDRVWDCGQVCWKLTT